MHPLEAWKSVAAEIDAKIDTKNDQKMVPRWGQNLVKNRFQDGFGNEFHLGPILGPSWDHLGANSGKSSWGQLGQAILRLSWAILAPS